MTNSRLGKQLIDNCNFEFKRHTVNGDEYVVTVPALAVLISGTGCKFTLNSLVPQEVMEPAMDNEYWQEKAGDAIINATSAVDELHAYGANYEDLWSLLPMGSYVKTTVTFTTRASLELFCNTVAEISLLVGERALLARQLLAMANNSVKESTQEAVS